jgi:hypothetical protein
VVRKTASQERRDNTGNRCMCRDGSGDVCLSRDKGLESMTHVTEIDSRDDTDNSARGSGQARGK